MKDERPAGRYAMGSSDDRYATLGPLLSVLLFLAAITTAFWYLRNEEFERELEKAKRAAAGLPPDQDADQDE